MSWAVVRSQGKSRYAAHFRREANSNAARAQQDSLDTLHPERHQEKGATRLIIQTDFPDKETGKTVDNYPSGGLGQSA